jgi:hypothetical protein
MKNAVYSTIEYLLNIFIARALYHVFDCPRIFFWDSSVAHKFLPFREIYPQLDFVVFSSKGILKLGEEPESHG